MSGVELAIRLSLNGLSTYGIRRQSPVLATVAEFGDYSRQCGQAIRHFLGLCDIGLLYERRRAGFERKIGALIALPPGVTVVWLWVCFFECFNFSFYQVCLV